MKRAPQPESLNAATMPAQLTRHADRAKGRNYKGNPGHKRHEAKLLCSQCA